MFHQNRFKQNMILEKATQRIFELNLFAFDTIIVRNTFTIIIFLENLLKKNRKKMYEK